MVFASSMLGDRSRAQDVVQQVFLKLMDRSIEHPENWAAYLYSAVRNASRNEIRSNRYCVELDEAQPWFAVENIARDSMSERSLRCALWTLPEEQREVAVMHIWGDLTFAAIGRILEISENTAASRYRYALAQLREAMQVKKV